MARKSRKHNTITEVNHDIDQKPIYRVGAYIRLSVEDRDQKGNSLENQQSIIKDYINKHDDLELTGTYIDNGISGRTFERPEFIRMKEDLESHKINCCITKDLSRLGRNSIETGYYISICFPYYNIRYISVTDNYDSSDPKSGGIKIDVMNIINEYSAIETSRKVTAVLRSKIESGKFIGNYAPYGYDKDPEDHHKLIIDPYAAGIVKNIFDMAVSGKKNTAIREWLNGNRIAPPRRYSYEKGISSAKFIGTDTKWWSTRGVNDVLYNRVYCGDMVQGKHKKVGGVSVAVPPSEWIIVENTHEAIIDRSVYEIVQRLRDKSTFKIKRKIKSELPVNIFQGVVICGDCGMRMKRERKNSRTPFYYICAARGKYSLNACGGMRTSENAIRAAVVEQLNDYIPDYLLQPSTDTMRSDITKYKSELINISVDIRNNESILINLYEGFTDGSISEAEYRELKKQHKISSVTLFERKNKLLESINACTASEKSLKNANDIKSSVQSPSDLTRDIILKTVDRIVIHGKEHIDVKLHPFTNKEVADDE